MYELLSTTILPILLLILWILNLSSFKKSINKNENLTKIQIVAFWMSLLFISALFVYKPTDIAFYIYGLLGIAMVLVFFKIREKEYQNLRQKTLFDADGNFLLKEGDTTRMPL